MRTESAQLALDTLCQAPTTGIPGKWVNIMEHAHIERLAGVLPGEYKKRPEETYVACQRAIGACLLDQYIPQNPLTIGNQGYEGKPLTATTGAAHTVLDGLSIDGPEAVAEHLETFAFPRLKTAIAAFDETLRTREILDRERAIQKTLGPSFLKSGYGFIRFPTFAYGSYGYAPYFSAYALFPDLIETHFSLQADLSLLNNRAAARAYLEGDLPPLYRLDHDMADSRGTLASIASLDKMWFPHFTRCMEPVLKTGIRLVWHCDGNLMAMVPRLLDVGISGFQGFQYEDGMAYEKICAMKTRDGRSLIIMAGVSVTRTLPFGTPSDVKRELAWLVKNGPKTGLFLGCSSSITPGVPYDNIQTLIEGFKYYRIHGRG